MDSTGTCEWESGEVGISVVCGNGRGGSIEFCWGDGRVRGVCPWIVGVE